MTRRTRTLHGNLSNGMGEGSEEAWDSDRSSSSGHSTTANASASGESKEQWVPVEERLGTLSKADSGSESSSAIPSQGNGPPLTSHSWILAQGHWRYWERPFACHDCIQATFGFEYIKAPK